MPGPPRDHGPDFRHHATLHHVIRIVQVDRTRSIRRHELDRIAELEPAAFIHIEERVFLGEKAGLDRKDRGP